MSLIKVSLGTAIKKIPNRAWMIVAVAILILSIGITFAFIFYGGIFVDSGEGDTTIIEEHNAHPQKK